ncbi:hypothetical protein SAMN05216486_10377 [bacterium JGI 053]|nr:hypothetical protein SAMN05216486_10377 [bacterium JGI 053]
MLSHHGRNTPRIQPLDQLLRRERVKHIFFYSEGIFPGITTVPPCKKLPVWNRKPLHHWPALGFHPPRYCLVVMRIQAVVHLSSEPLVA